MKDLSIVSTIGSKVERRTRRPSREARDDCFDTGLFLLFQIKTPQQKLQFEVVVVPLDASLACFILLVFAITIYFTTMSVPSARAVYRQYSSSSNTNGSSENLPPRTLTRLAREVRDLHKNPPEGLRLVVDDESGVPTNLSELMVRVCLRLKAMVTRAKPIVVFLLILRRLAKRSMSVVRLMFVHFLSQ